MTATIVDGMPEREYRALPGLSGTEVAKILASPADLKWDRDHPRDSTPAQALGSLVHALVLGTEPQAVLKAFDAFRTAEAKAWRDEQVAAGLDIVTEEEWEHAEVLRDAVMAHPEAAALLDAPGRSEVTVTDEYRGVPLKGRIDRLTDSGLVIDLKTGRDVGKDAMERAMGDYGYATQCAHYAALVGSEQRPVVIAVRNERRPSVAVHRIGVNTWGVALRAVHEAWNRYADCIEADVWPDPNAAGIGDIDMKPWALDALERQITTAPGGLA